MHSIHRAAYLACKTPKKPWGLGATNLAPPFTNRSHPDHEETCLKKMQKKKQSPFPALPPSLTWHQSSHQKPHPLEALRLPGKSCSVAMKTSWRKKAAAAAAPGGHGFWLKFLWSQPRGCVKFFNRVLHLLKRHNFGGVWKEGSGNAYYYLLWMFWKALHLRGCFTFRAISTGNLLCCWWFPR